MRDRYDHIVVGGGTSGLTMSVILGAAGRRVLLVETAPFPGGSLRPFRRDGVVIDTGFHFTGGLSSGGILDGMLASLGIREDIIPENGPGGVVSRYTFEDSGNRYTLPLGIRPITKSLKDQFPREEDGIEAYIARMKDATRGGATRMLREEAPTMELPPAQSLAALLDSLITDRELKAILGAPCLCHGTPPSQVPFAMHAPVSYSTYTDTCRVQGGGEAFVKALEKRLAALGVDIQCSCELLKVEDIRERKAHSFVLSNGAAITAQSCILTIDPRKILDILPPEAIRPAFRARVNAFESSLAFFSVYAEAASQDLPPYDIIFPSTDMESNIAPGPDDTGALVIMRSPIRREDGETTLLSIHEPMHAAELSDWVYSRTGQRPADYYHFKQQRTDRMLDRLIRLCPDYKDCIKILDTASPLTYRDYLNSPEGSAYGIRQKAGQFSLLGPLPVRNMYAAGQSSLVPGLVGAMLSSFLVSRFLLDKEEYQSLVNRSRW